MHISWRKALAEKMTSLEVISLYEDLETFYKQGSVSPGRNQVFRVFDRPVHLTKVIILGQDPYPNSWAACGLAFAVPFPDEMDLPRSLQRIMKEMKRDVKARSPLSSYHTEQGVMLLNTALTVFEGDPGSHLKFWRPFTEKVIRVLNEKDDKVWMLWGSKAQAFAKLITNPTHLILKAGHPSPQAQDKFSGCKHFSKANAFLMLRGYKEINW